MIVLLLFWQFVVQSLSRVRLFATPRTAACQASLSFIISQSLFKLMYISSSVAPFSSCPQSFPASGAFLMNWLFTSGGQSVGASASTSFLPVNMQGWFPLGLTGLISLLPERLSRVFYSTTVRKHQFFGAQPSLWFNSHIHTWLLEEINWPTSVGSQKKQENSRKISVSLTM